MNASISQSRCEQIDIRSLRYNVRLWGSFDAPAVFMLHGWMDASATFQFVIDAMRREWRVIAPDWRGYGATQWLHRPYWFPDYYADLDALLEHYSPDRPARLVGHSMGGSVAAIYAGVRPQRVARLAMLDVLGLSSVDPGEAPLRIANWLDGQNRPPQMRVYPDCEMLAQRLMQANPRLTQQRAAFLARHVGRVNEDGGVEMACDPWHKLVSPIPYRVEEAMACWRKVTAPSLLVVAEDGFVRRRFADNPVEYQHRLSCFADLREVVIGDAGHNLQHDQPERVAAEIEAFLRVD